MKSNENGEFEFSPTASETTRTVGNSPRGNWEIPETSLTLELDRSVKARGHNTDMDVSGKSDSLVVPEKRANNAGQPTAAESVEGRRLTKENGEQPQRDRTLSRVPRSRGLFGVREAARRDKSMRFNNLLNHVTVELLTASFFDLKKQAAPGIDGVTWADYSEDFQAKIEDLHTRVHRGTYRAQPSKRTWIPKVDGKLRPLGVAAETFDFLGFTHISGKSRKGMFIIRRISALKKLKAKLKELKDKLKRMVHWDLAEVGSWLSSVYKGWCNYHAVPLNPTRLNQFRVAIQKIWSKILRRRSQRAHRMTWAKFGKLCRRWFPNAKIIHPYPEERFARHHRR